MMKLSINSKAALSLVVAGGLSACATATEPNQALQEARGTQQKAKASLADELAPAAMHEANQLLENAERAPDGSIPEIHYSRLAIDKYTVAMAEAQRREAERRKENFEHEYTQLQDEMRHSSEQRLTLMQRQLESARAQLRDVEEQLSGAPRAEMKELEARASELKARVEELDQQRAELEAAVALTEAELKAEREARKDAEERASQALDQIGEFAEVQRGENETVIVLTGAVLFRSGQSKLTPAARQKLMRVANALKLQGEGKPIIIEGHTDAQGPEGFNKTLSMQRAQSVKKFLVENGLSPDRIQTIGRGENEPIATNQTPEGRANNRRVEIVIGRG